MPERAKSETQLIRLIASTVKTRGRVRVGIGDDAAVLAGGVVLTTDAYAEGVHFSSRYMSVVTIGQRCACAALSDVVAMAAEPEALVVALCLPQTLTPAAVKRLYRGIEGVCARLGAEVAGGDIIASDRLVISLTATGRTSRPILRSTARPGDTVYVTGTLGTAEAGRLALENSLPATLYPVPVRRHCYPLPRITVMRRLRRQMHALIDTSDGLATDAAHIAYASGVAIEIDCARIPLHPQTQRLCQQLKLDPVKFALTAGEDYELLFTTDSSLPGQIAGIRLTPIGRVLTGKGVKYRLDGRARKLNLRGYDHLASHP